MPEAPREVHHTLPADEPERSVARIGPRPPEAFDKRARQLLRMLAGGQEQARRRLRAHVPRLVALTDGALAERATVADARLVIAREYGFPTWRSLVEELHDETAAWETKRRPPEPVAAALAAIRAGDAAALARLLDAEPQLAHVEVGAGGSLLGAIESARLLIGAGVDIERTNDFNGDNAVGWAECALEQERPGDTGVAAVRDLLRS